MSHPNCLKCKFFFISLNDKFPRGCRIFNIKGKNIPSVDVKRFTGYECPVFEKRKEKGNDKKYIRTNSNLDVLA